MARDADGLAAFVEGLPDGERHKGFFWAAMTAVQDGMGEDGITKVEQAGVRAGLDEAYVRRTIAEARVREA